MINVAYAENTNSAPTPSSAISSAGLPINNQASPNNTETKPQDNKVNNVNNNQTNINQPPSLPNQTDNKKEVQNVKKDETIYPDNYKKQEQKEEQKKFINFYGDEGKKENNNQTNDNKVKDTKEDEIKPSVTPSKNNNNWINNSVFNLDKTGDLKVPSWIDYNSLVNQKDFALMLMRVTKINNKDFFGELDHNALDKTLQRGVAFDAAIKAFGLEKEMERIGGTYKTRFKDLPQAHKYYNACLTAEVLKLSAGYPDGTFRPDDLLKWSEAIAIVESVHRWASLLPEQTPLQKANDFKKNIWYYFLDGFRLVLTLIYSILSIVFLIRSWKRAQHDKTGLKEIISSLCFAIGCLFIMWLNEMLYARELINKPVYYIISTISVIAGVFLIRTSSLISKQVEPKPKANVEVAYVEYVDISRGEMFVVDSITKRRILALISNETKVYNKENKVLGKAFLSEIAVGDVISLKGTEQISGGAVVKTDTIYLMASKQSNTVKQTKKQNITVNQEEEVQIQNIVRRNN